ncbi:MAG: VOC family protein [Deltaproteobacteria bacterium]|nr:VOC family protein [Deltaproteobacteria bacterium]
MGDFQYLGLNHVALVCKDMKETVDFYAGVLEMPLIKTIDLPGGHGQHFFFDIGQGASIAFFWFPDAPEAAPGIASPSRGRSASTVTAHGSMNHLAMSIPLDEFDEYVKRLESRGVTVRVINHADNPQGFTKDVTSETFIRSMYFFDPNGVALEFAAYTRALNERDVSHEPATHDDRERYLAMQHRGRAS